MANKCYNNVVYGENTRVFSVFQYVTAYKRTRPPIKLTYKVRTFRYCYDEIGVLVE
jgi:hypothetical protein